MIRAVPDILRSVPRNLKAAAIVLAVLPVFGTAGYMLIEGWGVMDALYMTVMVVTTIGFREVHPLSTGGEIFTMLLAVLGVGAIFYALVGVFQFLLEGELVALLGVRRMKGQIGNLSNHFILCGYGRVGRTIAQELKERGGGLVIVESNAEAIAAAQETGFLVVAGDATTDTVLRDAGIERARGLLAASDSDSGNTFIVLTAKALQPDLYVVARAGRPESEARMLRAGADRVFSPYVIAGRQMAMSAVQPVVVELIDTLARDEGAPILAEIDVSADSRLPGRTIGDLLHTCETVVVLGLQKATGDLKVGPGDGIVLEAGDRLIVRGREDELEAIKPGGSRNDRGLHA